MPPSNRRNTSTDNTSAERSAVTRRSDKQRAGLSYKDVMVFALGQGHDSVKKLYDEGKIKHQQVYQALAAMKATMPEKHDLFAAWVDRYMPPPAGKRTPPADGEERVYIARSAGGVPHIRIPCDLIAKEGEKVRVRFSVDGFHLTGTGQKAREEHAPRAVALG